MHISIPANSVMEFITNTKISPSISEVSIKICYVGENRNGTYFSKEVLTEMGRTIGGCPIVGYYNEATQDFEGHNRSIQLGNGDYKVIDMTKAYGFVPTDAQPWFQVFVDDGTPHEYLCVKGYLWTKVYEEAQRIVKQGNNQSMEIDGDGTWAESENEDSFIFIYSEALIDKLCVLGEAVEPCFEGAQIKDKFELHEQFEALKRDMYAMIDELKGGKTIVITTYNVTIGDTLWTALYSVLNSEYNIRGVMIEGEQKFAILQKNGEEKFYRMNFTFENDSLEFSKDMTEFFVDGIELQFSLEDNTTYRSGCGDSSSASASKKQEEDDSTEEDKKKKDYNLDEIPEYVELKTEFSKLQDRLAALTSEIESLKSFKKDTEKEKKQALIDQFYMLSDEDKKDCVDNIDTYSLDEIEAKLSIICVRNKVSFAQEEEQGGPNMFNLNNQDSDNDGAPAWVRAVRQTQKNKEEF